MFTLLSLTSFHLPTSTPSPPSLPTSTPHPPLTFRNRGLISRRKNNFPKISSTADVTIIDGGYWATKHCKQPIKAMIRHLPEFVHWARSFARPGSRVILRTAPPVPNYLEHCSYAMKKLVGPASNLLITHINLLIREFMHITSKEESRRPSKLPSLHLFDGWRVEAPQYMENCPKDHHYSCYHSTPANRTIMTGRVGEAMTMSIVHFLLTMLPSPMKM